jgi:peroxiredoxin
MKKLAWIAIVWVGVAVPASCSMAAGKGPQVGDKVVDFNLKGLDGKVVKTAEFREDKVFVLKFGATWCGWCNRQIPELNKVQKEYADKVAVLDVAVREKADKVQAHNKKKGTKYNTVLDPKGIVAAKYGVRGIPVVIVADQDGKILYKGYYTKFAVLKKVIDKALPPEAA